MYIRMHFNRYIPTIGPIISCLLILILPTNPISPLNSINGLNPLYLFTVLTFKIPIIGLLILSTLRVGPNNCVKHIIWVISLIYLLACTKPNFYKIINYSNINTGLFNPLGQYHPALLFMAIISGFVFFFESNYFGPTRTKILSSWKLIITLLLSSWWANQELFWGNYWNWDPVEMSSLLVLVVFLVGFHSKSIFGQAGTGIRKVKFLITILFTVAYITNRGPTANSVHQFSGTFYLKIDSIWFWLIWFFFITILFWESWCTIKLIIKKYIEWGSTPTTTPFIVLLIGPILIIFYLYMSISGLFHAKTTYKVFICILLNLIPMLQKKHKVKLPKKSAHTIPVLIFFIILMYSEPPQNTLFGESISQTVTYIRASNNYSLLSKKGGHCNYLVNSGYYKTSIKHQSIIFRNITANTITKSYTKFNTNNTYVSVDSNNINKLFFFLVRR